MHCCGSGKIKGLVLFLLLTGLGLYITYNLHLQHPRTSNKSFDAADGVLTDSRNDSSPQRRLPNALIIGSAKCGTRALLVSLKIHPDIRSYPKELKFFNQDENYAQGLEWYRKQMPFSKPNQITIEKTPGYFIGSKVPERIYQMNKDIRLLLIVRDPTVRAISDYAQLLEHQPMPPFEEYVTTDSRQTSINKQRLIIRHGVYVNHLLRWLRYFPPGQIHIISGEELIKNPAPVIKSVEKFLGLRPYVTAKNFYFNKTKGFQCFIGKIKFDGKRTTGCLNSSKGRKHPHVKEHIVKMLQDYYRPYNERFYTLAGRNFNWP